MSSAAGNVVGPGAARAKAAIGARLRRGVAQLGPGLITGAADDDPSGIATYSTAGAAFGFGTLWSPLFTFPLMAAVQLMCARLGLVTQRGLAGTLRAHYPRWLVWSACAMLLLANTVNIAADLSGMAEGLELVTGVGSIWFHCVLALVVIVALVFSSYRAMARTLKWLTLVLLAYVGAAFLASPPWGEVIAAAVTPRLSMDRGYVLMLVAILGTTISPYLFFWQASQEVEETKFGPAESATSRPGTLPEQLGAARRDVLTGMFASNVIAFFIILTTGTTLYTAGLRDIATAGEAAVALRPLAGDAASLLFSLGLLGTGLLGVPVLAGSSAYAVAEAGGWPSGMDERPRAAKVFYATLVAGLLLGMALDHLGLSGFRMLFWAAVLNGVLAPPLIALILVVCNDRRIMGEHANGWLANTLGVATAVVMTAAALMVALT